MWTTGVQGFDTLPYIYIYTHSKYCHVGSIARTWAVPAAPNAPKAGGRDIRYIKCHIVPYQNINMVYRYIYIDVLIEIWVGIYVGNVNMAKMILKRNGVCHVGRIDILHSDFFWYPSKTSQAWPETLRPETGDAASREVIHEKWAIYHEIMISMSYRNMIVHYIYKYTYIHIYTIYIYIHIYIYVHYTQYI